MSNKDDFLGTGENRKFRLSADILMLQMKGAGYAAVVCIAVVLGIWALATIGKMLPEESRETEDPTPVSYHHVLTGTQIV